VDPSATTIYTVTALSDANCAAQAGDLSGSAVVTVNPRPASAVSGSATICNGGTTTIQAVLTGTGPWNLTWSDGTNQTGVATSPATRTVDPSATTIYTVTALSDANCTAQAGDLSGSAVVTVNPRPTAAVSGGATICNGGSTTIQAALSGTGPWNLTWSDGANQNGVATSPATRNVGPSATTIYTVTALSDANCTAQAGDLTGSAVVTVNPRPTAAVSGDATICNGGTTTIQAALTGTGPWDLTWSDGTNQTGVATSPATRDVDPSATTIYTVTALSDANCTAQVGDLTGSAVVTVQTGFEAWQLHYFGCTDCPEAAATADPDGDGQNNLTEFLAGFNPTNNAASLHIINIVKSNNDLVITYLGANGDTSCLCGTATRTNVLEFAAGVGAQGNYTNNFVDTGLSNILTGGTGLGTNVVVTDVGGATNRPSRFYRVRVLVP
jgi:ribosomal protein S8E